MTVVHLYSGNLFGGVETILLTLARHSVRSDVAHRFVLCFDGRLARELRAAGAAVDLLPEVRASRPQTLASARRRLAKLIPSIPVDVCVAHAPWSYALFGAVARGAGLPVVFWAHDVWHGAHWTERWARRTAPDLIVANSAFTARTLQRVHPRVPRVVVHAPLDLSSGALTAAERAAVRAELQTPDDSVVFVQASRLEAWKGHETLLRALAPLRRDPRWTCWIVGGAQRPAENRYRAALGDLAADLGISDRVRFAGERCDVPRLLAASDVYCQPNAQPEPFGVVFVEALAASLPVVTSGIGGAVEIVDGSCGRLLDPGDVSGWRGVLSDLLTDGVLRARLGSAGPARAASLCAPARQLSRLHDALRSTQGIAVAG